MLKKSGVLLFYLGLLLFAALAMRDDDGFLVPLRLINGTTDTVLYYIPQRMGLSSTPRERNLRLPAFPALPRFGTLVVGSAIDSLITIAIEEIPRGPRKIYIDRNNDGDLTNDGTGDWDEIQETYVATSARLGVKYAQGHSVQLAFRFYRFATRLPDAVLYYRDYCGKGTLVIADQRYDAVLVDDNADGRFDDLQNTALIIDSNQDGKLEGSPGSAEMFGGHEPFHLQGESYVLREVAVDGQWARFGISSQKVAAKARIEIGQPAPEFSMIDFAGTRLRLSDFRGQIVLLYFWATWCRPCLADLPHLLNAYRKFQSHEDTRAKRSVFNIIGISLDEDRAALQKFLDNHDMPWRQLFDGQGWKMQVAQQYRISSLPRTLLLDGQGVIRYIDLRGADLANAIARLLEERRTNQAAENPEFRRKEPYSESR